MTLMTDRWDDYEEVPGRPQCPRCGSTYKHRDQPDFECYDPGCIGLEHADEDVGYCNHCQWQGQYPQGTNT